MHSYVGSVWVVDSGFILGFFPPNNTASLYMCGLSSFWSVIVSRPHHDGSLTWMSNPLSWTSSLQGGFEGQIDTAQHIWKLSWGCFSHIARKQSTTFGLQNLWQCLENLYCKVLSFAGWVQKGFRGVKIVKIRWSKEVCYGNRCCEWAP